MARRTIVQIVNGQSSYGLNLPTGAGKLYASFTPCDWSSVKTGDHVWIDNLEHGRRPFANPPISGPFEVMNIERRQLRAIAGKKRRPLFSHVLNNLLRQTKPDS